MQIVPAAIAWIHAYYAAPDRDTALALAAQLGFAQNAAGVWCHPDGHAVDVVGVLRAPDTLDAEGEVIAMGAELPGFHVNIAWAGDPDPRGEAFRVHPATPLRRWA